MKTTLLSFFILLSGLAFAQDSLNFPLKIGNYWEYSAMFEKKSWKVKSDTTMPNGKHYFYIEEYNLTYHSTNDVGYFRADGGKFFRYFPASICDPAKEYVLLDFTKNDKEIWPVCVQFFSSQEYIGIDTSYTRYSSVFQKNINEKRFRDARIVNNDTLWGLPIIDGPGPDYAAPGIGYTHRWEAFIGDWYLSGAILNGIKYGTITDINDDNYKNNLSYSLSDNYPNPFNPSTEISYSIKSPGFVSLKVYNILGKEVSTLVNETKNSGIYKVTFNAKDIPSGVYFYSLNVNDYSVTKKMVLTK